MRKAAAVRHAPTWEPRRLSACSELLASSALATSTTDSSLKAWLCSDSEVSEELEVSAEATAQP